MLTVVCVAYNQEKYISQALDGFVRQKTDFPFQVLVGDDASTDKTPDIIKRYAEQYPDLIKPLFRSENIGSARNSYDLFSRVQTPYVAICDGDDYWTDELKLQKQVDFLEKNSDFSICFHAVRLYDEDNAGRKKIFPGKKALEGKDVLETKDLLKYNFMQANSIVYRWNFEKMKLTENEFALLAPGDWYLALMHSRYGKIKFFDEVMGVYRLNKDGIWNLEKNGEQERYRKYGMEMLNFYRKVMQEFDGYVSKSGADTLMQILKFCAVDENKELYDAIGKNYFDLFCRVFSDYKSERQKSPKNMRQKIVNLLAKILKLQKPYK